MGTILERIQRYDDDRAFLRRVTIPEEDRHRFGYRLPEKR